MAILCALFSAQSGLECGVFGLRFLGNTLQDASPGSGAGSCTSGLLAGKAVVTGLLCFPLNPFWNKVEYEELKDPIF